MKKVVSILLLILFLFNVGGYYLVFWGMYFHHDNELTARVDAGLYSADETVELKIPMSLPYPLQDQGYQRVDGRFEHQGNFYKMVEHKISNDTLYIVCLRDKKSDELSRTMKGYLQLTQSLPVDDNTPDAFQFLSKLIKDYVAGQDLLLTMNGRSTVDDNFAAVKNSILSAELVYHGPPPRA